jgi:hypothetical protein
MAVGLRVIQNQNVEVQCFSLLYKTILLISSDNSGFHDARFYKLRDNKIVQQALTLTEDP